MDITRHTTILKYLESLGISPEGARIYSILVEQGPCSIMDISRLAQIERTRIYRILDSLIEKGIIEEQLDYKRRMLKAADIQNIEYLVNNNLRKAKELSDTFSQFTKTIEGISHGDSTTSVQFYRGKEGIKQMLWNELSAKTESLCFIYKIFDGFVGSTFFDHWAEEFGRRGLRSREIRTEIFDQSYLDNPNDICFRIKNVDIRYIPSKEFPLTHGVTIYDNVVAIYDFWEDSIFGVEMYNQRVADMQRIFFNTYWSVAKPRPYRNPPKPIVKEY